MMPNVRTSAILLCLACLACGVDQSNSDQEFEPVFFDLEAYFDQEIQRLNEEQPKLIKTVIIGDETEEKELEAIDFKKELQVFLSSDINRPAWVDKYQGDSIHHRHNGQLLVAKYTALDTSLRTRLVEVSYKDAAVERIKIKNKSNSSIASSSQDLLYQTGHSYHITSRQKTIGSDPKEVRVHVKWVE